MKEKKDENISRGKGAFLRAAFFKYKYNTSKFAIFLRYAVNGLVVAFSQLVSILILVGILGLKTKLEQNIANIISIEISILVGFFLHFHLTWRHQYTGLLNFLKKMLSFHLVSAVSVITRITLFYILLNYFGVEYMFNTLIGMAVAVLISFIGYDKFVFQKGKDVKQI
jgi:dolichol-phosphate mannosyltransferase